MIDDDLDGDEEVDVSEAIRVVLISIESLLYLLNLFNNNKTTLHYQIKNHLVHLLQLVIIPHLV